MTVKRKGRFKGYHSPEYFKWISAMQFKPSAYSLVKLLLSNGKEVYGWWYGTGWYSRHLGTADVKAWKKHAGEY